MLIGCDIQPGESVWWLHRHAAGRFRDFVYNIARTVGFPAERIILGGDHLGPNCWQDEPAAVAMEKSIDLIKAYVAAGFSKIHLDASMSCADDPVPLILGGDAARLCQAAEETASDEQKRHLTYVIGTEVPVPGGEASTIGSVHVTRAQDAAATLETHEAAFRKLGLDAALERVIAIVVQPGVEFDHTQSFITSRRKRKRSPPGSKAPRWSTGRTPPTTKPARLIVRWSATTSPF